MSWKTVSQLDARGYFVGPAIAYESPLEPGIYLLPAGAIDARPPSKIPDGQRAKWNKRWEFEELPPAPPEPEEAAEPAILDPVEKLKTFLAANPDVAAILQP